MKRSYYFYILVAISSLFIICQPILADDFSIAAPHEIHTLELDTPVQTTGVVIVEPGVLGSQFFYINGAQVYSYYKDFPELHIGDKIMVKGVISQSRGEKRIKTKTHDDIIIIHPNYQSPTSIRAGIGDINDDLIGQLVTIKGRVVERTGQRIYIDEGGIKEVVVYIKQYTDIDPSPSSLGEGSRISEGDSVEVTGVVSRSSDELRILPRSNNDITFLETRSPKIDEAEVEQEKDQKMLASEGSAGQVVDFNTIKPYFIISSIILGLIFILLLRAKHKSDKV